MISPTGRTITGVNRRRGPAFTLVELILVMVLLTIMISIAAPALANFFRGRALDMEAGRFLALTRYGQSHAVSAGTPMVLWVHLLEGTYGLREESRFHPARVGLRQPIALDPGPYRVNANISMEYQVAKDLRLEVDKLEILTNHVGTIRFAPDGSIDDASLNLLIIRDKDNITIPIILAPNRMKYEIVDEIKLRAGAYR